MKPDLLEFWRNAPDDPFDAFFEHAPILMHSIDETGTLTKVSRQWAELLGYTQDEMVGRKSVDFLTEASRRRAQDEVFPEFIRTGVIHNVDYDFVRKDGSTVPVLLSASSVLDAEGNFIRSLAIIFDNTETKRAAEALREKAREAEEASRTKSQFLAAMSHEIRTPMNAILGFAQLLEMSKLDEPHASQVSAILSSGRTLMTLLTDLLDLSQAEAGHMRIDPQPFSLHQLIHNVTDWWAPAARSKGLKLSLTLDKAIPDAVIYDAGRLQQILNNLLDNAIKYTNDGRVELVVEEVSSDPFETCIRFEVRDTGPGLTAEQIKRAFHPFVQMEGAKGRQRGGWGLGLSICHNLAEAMDADFGVSSVERQGTVFHLEVTASLVRDDTCQGLSDSQSGLVPNCDGLRILVVEDNEINAAMLIQVLQELGHHITHVTGGEEAIKSTKILPFDLILMDIMMPGIDGVETARRIRDGGGACQHTPILACSALVTTEDQAKYADAGMDGLIAKPIDRSGLISEIHAVATKCRECQFQPQPSSV